MGNTDSISELPPDQTSLVLANHKCERIPFAIPAENQLKILNLRDNKINTLPKHLEHLTTLILSYNGYKEITRKLKKQITSMKELSTLDLSNNSIKVFPVDLLMLPELNDLRLFANELEKLDLKEGMLEKLEKLDLSQNYFENLPLLPPSLTTAVFEYNRLNVIKVEHEKLSTLRLSMNRIDNFDDACRFACLRSLDLSMNKLSTLPDMSVVTPMLEKLDFSNNMVEEMPVLPKQSIKEIKATMNRLTIVPEGIIEFENLTYLDISFNMVKSLPKLPPKIHTLFINDNEINEVTESEMKYLGTIDAHNNKLKEMLPFESNIIYEYYSFNNLIGSLVEGLISKNIVKLNLQSNKLEEIPDFIFNLEHLIFLDVCNNNLKKLPENINNSKLQSINISENPFEELNFSLPETLLIFNCSMCKLKSFGNALNKCGSLKELSCFNNEIKEIPNGLEKLTSLRASMNKFTAFPKLGMNIANIDLSYNEIESLPDIFNYEELVILNLSNNNISNLPENIFSKCTKLKTLKLANNVNIEGEIKLDSFPELETLDIFNTKDIKHISENKNIREIITNKVEEDQNLNVYKYFIGDKNVAYSEDQGARSTMEDAIIIRKNIFKGCDLYAVFDGHGGSNTADYCSREFPKLFSEKDINTLTEDFIKDKFKKLINSVKEKNFIDGTTASIIFIWNGKIISVNLGDSRSLVIKDDGTVKFASKDHKPYNRDEIDRVIDMRGRVFSNRINGILAVSRSIGDFDIYGVGYEPTIKFIDIEDDDKWVLLCCDGVFDVISNEEIGKHTKNINSPTNNSDETTKNTDEPAFLAHFLSNLALTRLSLDNISVIAIKLHE